MPRLGDGRLDGIYVGGKPHPAVRCFALPRAIRNGDWTGRGRASAPHAARRFGFKDRGLLRQGFAADVVVLTGEISDRSTYDNGGAGSGVEHVLVNGVLVLLNGSA